jgi:hypothetical protein
VSTLQDIIARGAQVRTRLRELLLRHEYPGDTKNLVLMAYVDLALEHHDAMWQLTATKRHGSAFALLRLVFDAMQRGYWINKCASPEQIEATFHDEFRFPRTNDLLADIKRDYLAPFQPGASPVTPEQADQFIKMLKELWRVASSYTHSGSLQLSRRFTDNHVKPNYSEDDIVRVLASATTALFLLLNMFFVSMGQQDEAKETRTMLQQFNAQFKGRLRP